MNVHSLFPAINALATVLVASGVIVTLAAIGAFLPLRNGNGQHAGAGPGAVNVWQVRDHSTPGSPRLSETPEPPQFSAPIRPPESHRSDTPDPAALETPHRPNEIPDRTSETHDPHTELYGYPDLYSCRALFDAAPAREVFDTITVQRLEPPHNPEITVESPLAAAPAWYAAPCPPPARSSARVLRPQPPSDLERLLQEGITAATDPHPYTGKHRLRVVEEFPAPRLHAPCAA